MRDMKAISQKNREYQEKHNPCYAEEVLTRKCLMENNANKDKCTKYCLNVRTCRDFWEKVKHERRLQGIRPDLPPPVERDQLKAEYLKNKSGIRNDVKT